MSIVPSKKYLRLLYAIAFFLFSAYFIPNATAQLQANFTVDKQGGCSPLSVKFTNTSTGTSAGTTWQWNFGNANTSALKEPGATYFTEKVYTVTLTAKDGGNTSTKTMDITVYKKPTVDFSVSPAKGCAPLLVNYTATATAGNGTIANYLWDVGDGSANIQGASYNIAQHTYAFPQKPPITLIVTNSFGCYATVTKANLVDVVKNVTPAFTPSAFALCNAGESISFANASTGSGTLSYSWDFGDGKTSTEQSPVHIYASSGSFVPTLTVTSSDGCSASIKSNAINVANFIASFTYPSKICSYQTCTFVNTSTRPFDRAEWWIDNSPYAYTTYNNGYDDYPTNFYEAGEHTIKLVVYYGNCSVTTTKKITVNASPVVNGFVAELQGACGVPVTINYKDTTAGAVAWQWQTNFNSSVFGTAKNAAYTYTSNSSDYVSLTVTNAGGCSSTISKFIYYDKPYVTIYATTVSGENQGCTGLSLNFTAYPDSIISTYKWNFGDGTATSTEKSPTHVFNKGGSFVVSLEYTTTNGCKGTVYYNNVTVVDKPKFDFSTPNTTVCGNTPTSITATPQASGWYYYWSFNEDYGNYYYGNSSIIKQFTYDTTYTVTLIAVNNGCRDTVIKKDYIKVLPPFPHIQQALNTCAGTRGDVRFTEDSKKALQWSWDFGDGTSSNSYTSFTDTIRHTFSKTGAYNVVLSTTNGSCTVRDSLKAYVLLKQKPLLTTPKADACGSETVNFTLAGYEANPYNYTNNYYYLSREEYEDLTPATPQITLTNYNYYYLYFMQNTTGTLQQLDAGKNGIRFITTSSYFGCEDTTNFMPIKIHGPKAGFKIEPHSGCFKDAVSFTDTSQKGGNIAIVRWEWNFGDGQSQALTSKGSTTHRYASPGFYTVQLKVTDADGCTNQTAYYSNTISVGGPKADFTASAYTVPINTTVYLNNNSLYYDYYSSSLQWLFADGTTSTDQYPSVSFTEDGIYPIRLITTNLQNGCTDTITKNITVRKVNSAYTYLLSYINANSCPPVIATFTSVSTNAARLSWDFGDGGVAGDQATVTHTYNNPGIYRVVHYSYDSNNGVDSTEDFIEVKGPYALLKADALSGCSSLQVKLTADVKYASGYTWDFGDGTVVPTTDTFALHTYVTPGIYIPALILRDAGGCAATSALPNQIIVDSLLASFKPSPATICDAGFSTFSPQAYSLSNDQLQVPLQYMWVVKEGAVQDTLYNDAASHYFTTIGTHPVSLTITTPYGCQQIIKDSVMVKAGVNASISGIHKVCIGDVATFTSSTAIANPSLQWNWNFSNGNTSSQQNPVAQQYNTAGPQQISLIVNNGFCSDTVYHALLVNSLPSISFAPAAPFACKGSSINLSATGGTTYQWAAAAPINNTGNATITTKPASSIFYAVKVKDGEGCSNSDSIFVKVIDTIKVVSAQQLFACEGKTLQFDVAGADTYKWINNTAGLSNTAIANPSLLTNTSAIYTVVGYDNYHCFTDTALINVRISKLPVVNAGAGMELIAGSAYTLSPAVSGAVSWVWSPADYLSCTACLSPVSKPKSSVTYTLTAQNADGCKASGTVSLKLVCKSSLVYIPNAFSPNNDSKNDRFTITGSGIKSIQSIIIYSRWGKPVFERKNISINDTNNSWDGTFNGEPMPPGAYVYFIKAECEGGDVFDYRGNVMIVR